MRLRIIILLVIAAVVGFGTVHFTRQWLDAERSRMTPETRVVQAVASTHVLVAARNLPRGQFVRLEDLRWQAWPDEDVPETYMQQGSHQLEEFVGAVARVSLMAGEPVTRRRLVKPGERGFLAAVLTPGMRAVAVPINETSGVAGLVFPGDRVDVLLTHSVQPFGASRVHKATETVLTNIRVLAIDQVINDTGGQPRVGRTATFELTPHQVEMVQVLRQIGDLSLSLRSLAQTPEELDGLQLASAERPLDALGQALSSEKPRREPQQQSTLQGDEPEQTYTLDTEVSVLLAPPPMPMPEPIFLGPEPMPEPLPPAEPEVVVFRGHSSI